MATKGELTRNHILDEAAQVFNRQGFAATTVTDILAATGATKGNLYFHFSGMEEIGLEVLRRAGEGFRQFLDAALQGPSPGASLDNFFHSALEIHRSTGFVGGCLFGNTALETSDTAPEFLAQVSEVFTAWTGRLGQTVAAAQAAGQLRADLPADWLAELVVAAVEGAIMQSRMQKDDGPLTRALETLRTLLELRV